MAKTETTLSPDESALVTSDNGADLELLAADLPEGAAIPRGLAFLLACVTRWHEDPDFVEDQIRWMKIRQAARH